MSRNPNVEKAVELLLRHREFAAYHADRIAELFNASGLLVTPLHERALKACEEYATKYRQDLAECAASNPTGSPAAIVHRVGRESLASKKPKESWTAEGSELWMNGRFHTRFCTHAEAKAAQAALNALEAK